MKGLRLNPRSWSLSGFNTTNNHKARALLVDIGEDDTGNVVIDKVRHVERECRGRNDGAKTGGAAVLKSSKTVTLMILPESHRRRLDNRSCISIL